MEIHRFFSIDLLSRIFNEKCSEVCLICRGLFMFFYLKMETMDCSPANQPPFFQCKNSETNLQARFAKALRRGGKTTSPKHPHLKSTNWLQLPTLAILELLTGFRYRSRKSVCVLLRIRRSTYRYRLSLLQKKLWLKLQLQTPFMITSLLLIIV